MDLEERIRRARAEIAASEKLLYELGYAPEVHKGQGLRSVRLRLDGHADLDTMSEAVSQVDGKPVHKDRAIGHQVKRFLDLELARGKEPLTHQSLSYHISKMVQCPPFPKEIDKINTQTVSTFYAWLRTESDMTAHSQYKVFWSMKKFVRFLADEELISLPRNLESRHFPFDTGEKKVNSTRYLSKRTPTKCGEPPSNRQALARPAAATFANKTSTAKTEQVAPHKGNRRPSGPW